jgi:hypothetical protein
MADNTDLAKPDACLLAALVRGWRVALWATGTALLVAGGGLWLARNRIADGVIADELASLGLPARYTIVSIGPGREVLANVVVGDPRRPDLVIDRAELSLAWSLTGPRIGQITLVRPRLYGTLHNGHASFGALDKVICPPREQDAVSPARLAFVDRRRARADRCRPGPRGVQGRWRGGTARWLCRNAGGGGAAPGAGHLHHRPRHGLWRSDDPRRAAALRRPGAGGNLACADRGCWCAARISIWKPRPTAILPG